MNFLRSRIWPSSQNNLFRTDPALQYSDSSFHSRSRAAFVSGPLSLQSHENRAPGPNSHHLSPSSPPPTRRCTIPLFLCFLIPAMLTTALFFTVSWILVHNSAVESVESTTAKLHDMVKLHLHHVIFNFLDSMATTTRMLRANIEWDTDPKEVERYLVRAVSDTTRWQYLAYVRTNGYVLSAARHEDGEVSIGERPADTNFSRFQNGSLWFVNGSGNRIQPPYASYSFDARWLPIYQTVATTKAPAFASPFLNSSEDLAAISYSLPIFRPDHTLDAVTMVSFRFSGLLSQLRETKAKLGTTGALLLLDSNSDLLVSSNEASLGKADRARLLSLSDNNDQVQSVTLDAFGNAFVIHFSFGDESTSHFNATGINWKLFAIIPRSEYFAILDRQFRVEIILISLSIVFFVLAILFFFRVFLIIPIRGLIRELEELRVILYENRKSELSHSNISRLTELANLHKALMDVVRAAENSVEERAKELAKTEQAEQANQELQRLMRAKEMFFAMMSHEMRTPLNALIGMAEVLLGTPLTSLQKECVEAMVSGGGIMLTLVNNILDFSKLEAERFVIERSPFSLRDVMEKVAQTFEITAEEKQLELIVDVSADIPPLSVGDPARLKQVLINLLGNAIKFTNSGCVGLSCAIDPETRAFEFEVWDTGIGLSPDTISQLFQPFVQGDASYARRFGGTGLGLCIAQRIVARMGGELLVTSDGEGKGSSFVFKLALGSHPHSSTDLCSTSSTEHVISPTASIVRMKPDVVHISPFETPVQVCIVDTIPQRHHALCELFRAMAVFDVELVSEIPALSDSKLAGPSLGQDVARVVALHCCNCPYEFRSMVEGLQSLAPPASFSWKVLIFCKMKSTPAACVFPNASFVSKPITVQKLQQALTSLVEPSGLAASSKMGPNVPVAATAAGSHCDIPILVVDDVELNQRVLTLKFQQRGFTHVRTAASGMAAVEAVRSASSPSFGLILMDIMMPEMDGFEATRAIKAIPQCAHIPILGVTGNCTAEVVKRCLDCGMVAAVAKPIEDKRFFDLITDCLAKCPTASVSLAEML